MFFSSYLLAFALSKLKTSHIATGLLKAKVQISENNLYYETLLTVKQHYLEVGTLNITEPNLGANANGMNTDANTHSNSTLSGDADLGMVQAILMNLNTKPHDPVDIVPPASGWTLVYSYQKTQIQSKDVFMATLGILSDVA